MLLSEQGVLIASYPDLDAATWVGDAGGTHNAAVHAGGGKFYRSSDAPGTTPNPAGPYLQLPEGRGYVLRGFDIAGTVDPDGASRFLGDNQVDAMQGVTGVFEAGRISGLSSGAFSDAAGGTAANAGNTSVSRVVTFDNSGSTSPNAAKTDDVETRMTNTSIHWGITY